MHVTEIPLSHVKLSQFSLRCINEEVVSDLSKSIQTNGLLQPILVRPRGVSYEVVFGNHRLEACKLLGLKSIAAVVEELPDDDCFLVQVVENLQRNVEINPLIEAKGYISLIDHGWTINKIAERIGKSDSYVSDRVGLVRRLHPAIAKKIEDKNDYLKTSHLELLARLKSKHDQLELSNIVERNHFSVRTLEKMISGSQPFRETVEENGGSLYVRLPHEIVEETKIEAGDLVYLYPETRRRIAIEPANLKPHAVARTTEFAPTSYVE